MGEISTSKSKLESLLRSKDIDWTEVIELLNEFPDLISLRIKENKLVLHLAADGDCPLKIFKELISLYPSGLKAPDKYTKLPIHYAVRNERGSKDIIEAILYSCPECAQIPNKDGTLALHYAAAFQSDVMIINMLISAFPKGSESRDNAGKIPLMYATEKKAPISIITSLLEANSDGVSFADKDGRIPLHYAVFKRESLAEDTKIEARYRGNAKWIPGKIVRARLEGTYDIQYDAKEKDSEKQVKREHIRIPFDLTIKSPNTCSNSDSCSHILDSPDNTSDYSNHMLEIVELLYNHKPEIIKIFDDNDRLPLHYAVMYNAPIAVVKALVSYYPNSVNLKDYEGNLPIQYAYSNQCDIVSYLLPKCYNTGFAWIWTLTQTNPEDKYLKQVEYILDNTSSSTQDKDNDEVEDDEDEDEEEDYESHIEKLSKLLDSKGCNAVDVATPLCKEAILKRLYFYSRYEIKEGPPEHKSATSLVLLAVDHKYSNKSIALKFMSDRDQFNREINMRENENYKLSDDFIIGVLDSHNGEEDIEFQNELKKKIFKKYGIYNYCIVMPAAERNLNSILIHERIAAREWKAIRIILEEITMAIDYLHSKGLLHGDLKPLNIMRVSGRYKLVDMDASVSFKKEKPEYVGMKYSSAYLPPEMIQLPSHNNNTNNNSHNNNNNNNNNDNNNNNNNNNNNDNNSNISGISTSKGKPKIKSPLGATAAITEAGGMSADTLITATTTIAITPEDVAYECVEAHPGHDMWALGVILFQLCQTRESN